MVTATICRLCENSAIIDPTVAEMLAQSANQKWGIIVIELRMMG